MDAGLKKILDIFNPWWANKNIDLGIERIDYKNLIVGSLNDPRITFVLGARRVGKTMLLFQTIYHLIEMGIDAKKILFLSMDNATLHDFNLNEIIASNQYEYVFLDEIYYVNNWENVIKSIYDVPGRKFKIVCSGSSAGLINTKKHFLTGRNLQISVYPLSFEEFGLFTNTKGYSSNVESYLEYGGYPEYVLGRHPGYHSDLLNDVVEKDIVSNFNIRLVEPVKELLKLIGKQVGFKTSINKLSKVLKISDDSVKSYLQHLEQSHIVSCIYKYSPSINDRIYSAKKYYFEDTGVRNNITGFEDLGSMAENAVYNHLKRTKPNSEIFYQSDSSHSEIDFMVVYKEEVQLVEVKYVSTVEGITNRLSGAFTKNTNCKNQIDRIVVTNGLNENISLNGLNLRLVSLENFLLK